MIYGRVSDEHGDPVRHASVQLFVRPRGRGAARNFPQTQTQTNDLGEYRFGDLLAGKYFLLVQARPWYAQNGLIRRVEPNQSKSDPLLDVVYALTRTFNATVVGGDTLDLAAVGATANLSGRVLPKPADPDIEQFDLTLVGDDNRTASTRLRKDGTFSFPPIQPGTYKPYLSSPRRRQYVQQLSASGAKVHGTEVTLDGSHDAQLTITVVPGVGHVTGVAQLDGKPKAGALVLLVPQSADVFDDNLRMDQSDSDGTFALADILPEKYWLIAIQDGWDLEWANPVVLQPFHEGAELLQIATDDTKKLTVNIQRNTKNNSP